MAFIARLGSPTLRSIGRGWSIAPWTALLVLAALLLSLLVARLSVPAYAHDYTIDFKVTGGDPTAPTGSFAFDGASFSNFRVSWDNALFDFTAAANSPRNSVCFGDNASGASLVFEILTQTITCAGATYSWHAEVPGLSFVPGELFFDWTAPCALQIVCVPVLSGGDFTGNFFGPADTLTPANPFGANAASAQGDWTIPEPTTFALFGSTLAGLFLYRGTRRGLLGSRCRLPRSVIGTSLPAA